MAMSLLKKVSVYVAKLSLVLSHMFTTKVRTINAVLVVTVIQVIQIMVHFRFYMTFDLLATKGNEFVHNVTYIYTALQQWYLSYGAGVSHVNDVMYSSKVIDCCD